MSAGAKNKKGANLAIIGSYPPPFGGVTIHTKRLLPYLDRYNFDYVYYNIGRTIVDHPRVKNVGRSLLWYLNLLLTSKYKFIHSHAGHGWLRIAIGLLGIFGRRKILFTAHSYSFCEEYLMGNRLRRWLAQYIFRRAAVIIAVNEKIYKELLRIGISEQALRLIPAFIPPPTEEADSILPETVKLFCKNKRPIIVANGAFVLRHGRDVYGLEMMVNLVEALKRMYPSVGLVVYIREGSNYHEDKFRALISRIESVQLKPYILLYKSKQEFYPIFRIADVFLRPTSTDGDAISIREAISQNVPVITSDCVPRPDGAILFPTGNQQAFENSVVGVLDKLEEHKSMLRRFPGENAAEEIIKLYKELLSHNRNSRNS